MLLLLQLSKVCILPTCEFMCFASLLQYIAKSFSTHNESLTFLILAVYVFYDIGSEFLNITEMFTSYESLGDVSQRFIYSLISL